jgi:SAM-dependent methyltransferase
MTPGIFVSEQYSHEHSLSTLNMLYEYDDFMISVSTMADMGCGSGNDLEWWATRTTRDTVQKHLNIRCFGVDRRNELSMAARYKNIQYLRQDFEEPILMPKKTTFDVVWCHDSFQYVTNPFQTLSNWWKTMTPDGMLVLILPQTTNIEFNTQAFDQRDGVYYNWTMVSLIHMLATSGFDCGAGFFLKQAGDPWLHAVVYRSQHEPMDPKKTSWQELSDKKLLPECVERSIFKHGHVRQRDLLLPWLDRSLRYVE